MPGRPCASPLTTLRNQPGGSKLPTDVDHAALNELLMVFHRLKE